MIQKFFLIRILILMLLLAACTSSVPFSMDPPVEKQEIINLVCGFENQADCINNICENVDNCPLFSALTSQAVFDFVKNYSECKDCKTPVFSPDRGIGKCIEFQVSEISNGLRVTFWVSENCSFRYGISTESRIIVEINSGTLKIERINPSVEYIENPLYCQTVADCYCLSGSGVPFLGCRNLLYAPLNWSGFYPGENCECVSNQCVEK